MCWSCICCQCAGRAGLIKVVRQRELSYASTGNGGHMHLSANYSKAWPAAKCCMCPNKGGGDALADLLPGRVQMMFCNVPLCSRISGQQAACPGGDHGEAFNAAARCAHHG